MTQVTLKQDGKITALLSGEIDHHWAAILREKSTSGPRRPRLPSSSLIFGGHFYGSRHRLILGRHKSVSARRRGGALAAPKRGDIKRMLSIAGIESKDQGRAPRSYNK